VGAKPPRVPRSSQCGLAFLLAACLQVCWFKKPPGTRAWMQYICRDTLPPCADERMYTRRASQISLKGERSCRALADAASAGLASAWGGFMLLFPN
jgi:hypothetical protein